MEQMRPRKQVHTLAALVNVIVDMSLESLNTLKANTFCHYTLK